MPVKLTGIYPPRSSLSTVLFLDVPGSLGPDSRLPAFAACLHSTTLDRAYPVADLSAIGVKVGDVPAEVTYAGVILPGLYQVNIVVPKGVPAGFVPVVASIGDVSTQSDSVLPFVEKAPVQ